MAYKQYLGDRLERFIEPEPNSGCWLWVGGSDDRGPPFKQYGRIWINGRTLQAHKVAYEFYTASIVPEGLCVCHKCDTPLCVNPLHMFLGTKRDNTLDASKKGRLVTMRGEQNSRSKLTDSDVLAIRSDTRTQRVIAAEYGVHQARVSQIKLRKCWDHLKEHNDANP